MPSTTAPLPPRKPRLIGFDLDGTLLDSLHGLRPEVGAALEALRASGIELAFLTGRRARTCRIGLGGGLVGELHDPPQNHDEHESGNKPGAGAASTAGSREGLASGHARAGNDYPPLAPGSSLAAYAQPACIATNSGCLLWDYPAWQRLDRRLLPEELVAPLVELLAPWSVNLYQDASVDETGVRQIVRLHTPEMALCTQRFGYNRHQATQLSEIDQANVTQLSMPGPPELVLEMRDKVRQRFGERLFAIAVKWPLVPCLALEVFDAQANKGSAMDFFSRRLGIPRELTMAVGDDTNDLPMFEWCGFSAAMPQAAQEIAAAASVQLAFDQGAGEAPPLVLARYLEAIAALKD
ncbi:HAD family phosphatase [bacterium]|nr:HAD family phosphatase [bacterium]